MTAATADWLTTDYYAVLGVPPDASDKQITRAYRRLARELHPDTRTDDGDDARFRAVTAAYEVLGEPGRRAEYDALRREAAQRDAAWRSSGGRIRVHRRDATSPRSGAPSDVVDGLSLEDLLAAAGGRPWRPAPRRPRAGADVSATVRLAFEQAVRGATVPVPLGGAPARTVQARIPPGVVDGQTVRLPGRGEPGSDGGPPGDLLVRVHVDPHPFLGRDGRDLTVTLPVTFAEAALGADVAVPTLDDPVTVRIPPGTASGTTLRVRGRGVPAHRGRGSGDLLVTVQVHVPERLTPAERAAVEQLAAATPGSPRSLLGV